MSMADMLCIQTFEGSDWSTQIDTILKAVSWAIWSTINSTSNYSPGQLAFSQDMTMQMKVNIDWELLKEKRQLTSIKVNSQENKNRLTHVYEVGDKVLILNHSNNAV